VADDVHAPPGLGGGRVTVPPRAEERFLPSVDRLESSMQAARRAFAQSKFDDALHQLDATLRLKPEYDAAWLLRGHVLQKRGDLEGALSSFEQALKRFNRKVQQDGILSEARRRSHYESPQARRKRKAAAQRRKQRRSRQPS